MGYLKSALFFFLIISCSPRIPDKVIKLETNEEIGWLDYAKNSLIEKDSIRLSHLQGSWKVQKAVYKVEENIRSFGTGDTLEIKGNTFIEDEKDIIPFTLIKNIISRPSISEKDSIIINKITSSELVLTIKSPNKNWFIRLNMEKGK